MNPIGFYRQEMGGNTFVEKTCLTRDETDLLNKAGILPPSKRGKSEERPTEPSDIYFRIAGLFVRPGIERAP